MGLSSVLNIASSGLRVTESSMDLVARNVANADTPGYTKKTLAQENLISDGVSFGPRDIGVTRAVDEFLQARLRLEKAAFSELDVRKDYLDRIDRLFGKPGGENALDTIFNEFTNSIQGVTATPEMFSTRQEAVDGAQTLAQQLRQLSEEVQSLRQLAEDSLDQGVNEVNEALRGLGEVNQSIALQSSQGKPPADLLDERDRYIDRISEYLEVRVDERQNGMVSLFTKSGSALLQDQPVQLEFDHQGNVTAGTVYSSDDAERGVGTITMRSAHGQTDLLRNGMLGSGRMGALVEMRDETLVEAQAQLDELAHNLAKSLSDKVVAGEAVTDGTQEGFDLDVADLRSGDAISLNFTPTPPGTAQKVTVVRVDDSSTLPLSDDATADPDDTVIGIDFSDGLAAAATELDDALDDALGSGISVSTPAGDTLRFLDDTGVGDTTVINDVTATVTSTEAQDEGAQLPLFVDGPNSQRAYTGSFDDGGQKTGFASRIAVNDAVVKDNELLVRHASSPQTPLGDTERPFELLDRLTTQTRAFSPDSGIGQEEKPFTGDIGGFVERVVTLQTGRAEQAKRAYDAKEMSVTSLQEKFSDQTSVDINQELSDLIELQNAFAANARVLQAVDEMVDTLFRVL